MISYEDLGAYSLKELYNDAKTNENTIDEALDLLFDSDGDEVADDGVIKGKNFSKELTEKAEGRPDSANTAQKAEFDVEGDYYVWYLNKNVTGKLSDSFTAVAYVRTSTDIIFLNECTASAKSIANAQLETLGANYAGGSLKYLAELAA